MTKEYTADLQRLFLEMVLQNAESYLRVQNIYNPESYNYVCKNNNCLNKKYKILFKFDINNIYVAM